MQHLISSLLIAIIFLYTVFLLLNNFKWQIKEWLHNKAYYKKRYDRQIVINQENCDHIDNIEKELYETSKKLEKVGNWGERNRQISIQLETEKSHLTEVLVTKEKILYKCAETVYRFALEIYTYDETALLSKYTPTMLARFQKMEQSQIDAMAKALDESKPD